METHLPLKEGTTFFRTCINGLNVLSGVGLLSIPFALSEGGWLSLILLLFVAIVSWFTGLLIGRCMDTNPLIKSYPDIGALAFGKRGRAVVSILVYMELYLLCVELLILEGDNLEKLFRDMGLKFGDMRIEGKQMFIPLTALVVLPTTWVSMSLMAYVCVGGIFACGILVCSVAWAGAVDGIGFNERDHVLLKLEGLPTTLSLFAFCYCGHAVFPTLFNSMKDKTRFPKVLAVCFAIATAINTAVGILGYLMYGANVKSQITLNLPLRNISVKIAVISTLIIPLTKYACLINPIITAIKELSPICCSRPMIMSILIRTMLVISTAIVASVVPFFEYVVAFTGSSLSMTCSLLIPCFCYLKINKAAQRFTFESIVIIGIIVMGVFVGSIATYSSIKEIVKRL